MKNFTINIDEQFEKTLDKLKESMGKTSRAEVIRLAVALLNMADDAKKDNQKICITNENEKVTKEILIP